MSTRPPFGRPPLNQPRRIITSPSRPITPIRHSMDDYNSAEDIHSIKDAPKSTKKGTLLAKWEKVIKKENDTAREESPPTEEGSESEPQ